MKKILFSVLMVMITIVVILGMTTLVSFASDGDTNIAIGPDWTQIIIAAVGLFFSAVMVPVITALFDWLKSKTKNEALLTAISEAQTVADNVVAGLQQNVVNELKAKSKDGKLTKSDINDVAKLAFKLFKADLSARSFAVLEANAESIKEYVGNLIEARLLKLKSAQPYLIEGDIITNSVTG